MLSGRVGKEGKMKVMTIHLDDEGDTLRVITDTPSTHYDRGFTWGHQIGEIDGYTEAADEVRNHLLGVIADVNWKSWIEKL